MCDYVCVCSPVYLCAHTLCFSFSVHCHSPFAIRHLPLSLSVWALKPHFHSLHKYELLANARLYAESEAYVAASGYDRSTQCIGSAIERLRSVTAECVRLFHQLARVFDACVFLYLFALTSISSFSWHFFHLYVIRNLQNFMQYRCY